jgi:hypothetical protein
MATVKGGEKALKEIARIVLLLRKPGVLKVGFLENARYPDGKPVAMIAAIQNFGAPRAGIPPRPFFTNMIKQKSAEWPKAMARLLKSEKYDAERVLKLTGEGIKGQLQQSIRDTNAPPLAASTIKRKGFAKPLIHTGHMINSVDYEVDTK